MLWDQHITLNPGIGSLCWLGRVDLRNWDPTCSEVAHLVCRWVHDTGGTRDRVYGQSSGRKFIISLGTMLQFSRPRYMLSWPLLTKFKWMLDHRNTSVFVLIVSSFEGFSDCQNNILICTTVWKALNDVFIQHSVGLFWVPRHYGVCGNEIANGLAREGTVHQFVRLEPSLGVSRHNVKKR
jgi:hypothetical protein